MIRILVLAFCKCLESIPNPTPPPSSWLCCTQTLVHVGEYTWARSALVLSTLLVPSDETTSLLPSRSICWAWYPPLHWWFPSWNGGYFRLGGIYFCLGSFTMSFFRWPFGYGLWTCMKLFCPTWFCEWFWFLCQGMWAHCSRSYSTFNITFFFFPFRLLTLEN